MIISASLFSYKGKYEDYIENLIRNGIRLLHIDYIEGNTEKEKLLNLLNLNENVVYDVHLIKSYIEPEDIEFFNKLDTTYLCYQFENLKWMDFGLLNSFKGKRGLAFTLDTPYEIIKQYIDKLDFVLIMCTIPGISGQSFNYDNIERIARIRKEYPDMAIHVDGGIGEEISALMSHLNVDVVVSGSYLAGAQNEQLAERICKIRYSNTSVTAKEVMLPMKVLTVIDINDSFEQVVYALNEDKISTVVVNCNNKGIGIITDGDIRRTILKYGHQSFELKAGSMANTNPITVPVNYPISNLIYDRLLFSKKIRAIPCVDKNDIVGIIDLSSLF